MFLPVIVFVVEDVFGVDVVDLGLCFFLLLRGLGFLVGLFIVLKALAFDRREDRSKGFRVNGSNFAV